MGKRTLKVILHEIDNLNILWQKLKQQADCKRLNYAFYTQLKDIYTLIRVKQHKSHQKFIIQDASPFERLFNQFTEHHNTQLGSDQIAYVDKHIARLKNTRLKNKYANSLAYFYNIKNALDSHAIVSKTDDRGTILSVNSTFCSISGYSREELVGENHRLLNSKTHDLQFFQTMWKTILSGQNWKGTVCNRKKDGGLYWVESTITPIFDEQKNLQGFISIRTDVTPTIIAQQEAEAANQAKSKFLASMSHELRTPLNAVIGYSQLLHRQAQDDITRGHIELIESSGKYLLGLINELLDLSRIEAGGFTISLETVDLIDVIQQTCAIVKPLADKKAIQLECPHYDTPRLLVRADFTRLKQVLLNLITNAIKYNEHNGQVKILVESNITTSSETPTTRVSIQDTGYGIAAEKQKHIFEPFNRLGYETSNTEGTGIGLSISKNLIELMQGRMGFDSELNVGSCFWFELEQAAQTQPIIEHNPVAQSRAQTLLYIEDNPINMALMEDIFEQYPQQKLMISPNGEHGIALAQEHLPDIVILDINLPDLDGAQILQRLKQLPTLQQKSTQFIALTAQDNLDFKSAGFDHYLIKPITFNAIQRLLGESD